MFSPKGAGKLVCGFAICNRCLGHQGYSTPKENGVSEGNGILASRCSQGASEEREKERKAFLSHH